jgi:hypothetical protein
MTRLIAVLGALVALVAPAEAAFPPASASATALACGLAALAERPAARLPDPIPLRRVLRPAAAPPPDAPDGDPFLRLTRVEFERRVQEAARNGPGQPRLVRADYRATLATDALAGTGQWTFSADRPAAFSTDPFKVAWRNPKWAEGRPASVSGSPALLWIEDAGRSTLAFDWSLRGVEEPGRLRFALAVPPATLAVLELDLPADAVPVAKAGPLIVGPTARPNARAAWRIVFAGESTLEFTVRKVSPAGRPPPAATFARSAKMDLAPGLAALAATFDVVPIREAADALEFRLDPGLAVSDVSAAGLAGWRVDGTQLRLSFREPFAGGRIAIAAAAPFPADGNPWPVPLVHPAHAPPATDQFELVHGPELKWEGLTPGDYRAVRAGGADRSTSLTFRGTLPADGADRKTPIVRFRAFEADVSTSETLEWRVAPDGTRLSARIRTTVLRGPLARLILKVPPGVRPVVAVVAPDDPTAIATPLSADRWAIEPTAPVPTGETLDVRVEWRGPTPQFENGRAALRLENPLSLGVGKRETTATVQLAPSLRGWFVQPAAEFSDTGSATLRDVRDGALELVIGRAKPADATLADPPAPRPADRAWRFADLAARAVRELDGSTRVELSGRILAIADRRLPIRLPDRGVFESARVDGRWADAMVAADVLAVPVPEAAPTGTSFLVIYRIPPTDEWPPRAPAFAPELPGAPDLAASFVVEPAARAWPSLAEHADPGARLIPNAVLRAVGLAVAAGILGFGLVPALRGPLARRTRIGWMIVVLVGGAAVWLAPAGWRMVVAPPFAVALVVLLVAELRGGAPRARFAAAASVALLPFAVGDAQAPAVPTVHVVADADGTPGVVLAPRSVIDRLAALAAPPRPAAALVDADYTGTETDSGIRFQARWRIEVVRSGIHEFELPLTGVKLETLTLDGAPAFPEVTKPGRYRIRIAGIGSHALAAQFVVPILDTPAGRELRCGIPDHPATRLALTGTAPDRIPDFPGRIGARSVSGTELRADLGPGGTIAIRWRDAAAAAPLVTVQDATVWELSETRFEAFAAFLHRVERGAVSRLSFEIPAGFEPGAFAVREVDAPGANGLKDWFLEPTPAGSRLALDLLQPARGTIVVTFRLVARTGAGARPALVVPRALAGESTASFLGVRLTGVSAEGWQNEHLLDVPADGVGRTFAAVPELEFDRTLARSLRREGPNAPVARPLLRSPPPIAPTNVETTWSLGARAEVVGTVQWTGAVPPLLECDLPPGVSISEVAAADLAGWERIGNRLRVWFKADIRDPTIKWIGTGPLPAPGTPVELPAVPGGTMRVRPAEGAAIAVPNAAAVKWTPTARPREWVYASGSPQPKFQVYPAPASAPAYSVNESLGRTGAVFEYRAILSIPLLANRPHAFVVSVANLPSTGEPKVDWPAGAVAVEQAGAANRRGWRVDFPAGEARTATIPLAIRFPVRTELDLPVLEVRTGAVPLPKADHRLALPAELRPALGHARAGPGGWSVVTDGPIRVVENPRSPSAEPLDSEPSDEAIPPTDPEERDLLGAGLWLLGFALLAGVARWGGVRWRPEWLAGYGALAAIVAGSAFAAIAVVGLGWRIARIVRAVGRHVGR